VHTDHTPLHMGLSCYVVDGHGQVLLTRRAASKRTWPSTWSNACCGHPRPGESLRQAVERHLRDELGLAPLAMGLALADFTYRAVMADGTVEHELCPVVVVTVDQVPVLAADEADAAAWVTWAELVDRATSTPDSLSPWSVRQVHALAASVGDPAMWIASHERGPVPSGRVAIERPPARRPTTPAEVLTPMGGRLEELMEAFLAERVERLQLLDPLAGEVGQAVAGLIRSGGKRLRPAFVSWGHRAAGGTADDDVVHLGLALEMLHTFALIHDDVMDRSQLRRGHASVHEQFGALRGTSDRAARWFGSSAAILAGDLAFVWSDELFDAACRFRSSPRLREAYAGLRTEVIAGQYLDLRRGGAGGLATEADAICVALLKSGRYTVTRPLELGAMLAGADEEIVAALRRYGDATGLAFQLRDDVLGLFGEPSVTGKGAIEDLREGKRTVLMLRALELTDHAGRAALERALGSNGRGDERLGDGFGGWPDDGIVERCRDIVAASGALASVEALIAAKVSVADEAIEAIAGLDPAVADALAGLVRLLTARVT
jgi:geranylgeranyl diphosphate synthase type I